MSPQKLSGIPSVPYLPYRPSWPSDHERLENPVIRVTRRASAMQTLATPHPNAPYAPYSPHTRGELPSPRLSSDRRGPFRRSGGWVSRTSLSSPKITAVPEKKCLRFETIFDIIYSVESEGRAFPNGWPTPPSLPSLTTGRFTRENLRREGSHRFRGPDLVL